MILLILPAKVKWTDQMSDREPNFERLRPGLAEVAMLEETLGISFGQKKPRLVELTFRSKIEHLVKTKDFGGCGLLFGLTAGDEGISTWASIEVGLRNSQIQDKQEFQGHENFLDSNARSALPNLPIIFAGLRIGLTKKNIDTFIESLDLASTYIPFIGYWWVKKKMAQLRVQGLSTADALTSIVQNPPEEWADLDNSIQEEKT